MYVFVCTGHEGWVQALCFSADGYMLVSCADDDMVKVWDVTDGKCLKSLEGRTESAAHCGFHPCGALVASGSAITTLVLANTAEPSDKTTGGETPAPPHELTGEEILDKLSVSSVKPRAQSARPSRKVSLDMIEESNETIVKPTRPGTAVPPVPRRQLITNVERWLSSSFQRL